MFIDAQEEALLRDSRTENRQGEREMGRDWDRNAQKQGTMMIWKPICNIYVNDNT